MYPVMYRMYIEISYRTARVNLVSNYVSNRTSILLPVILCICVMDIHVVLVCLDILTSGVSYHRKQRTSVLSNSRPTITDTSGSSNTRDVSPGANPTTPYGIPLPAIVTEALILSGSRVPVLNTRLMMYSSSTSGPLLR